MIYLIKHGRSVSSDVLSPGHAVAMSFGRELKADSTVSVRGAEPLSFFFLEEFLSALDDLLFWGLDAVLFVMVV